MIKRKTIMRSVQYSGIGIHKGETIDLKLLPAEVNTGITFKRVDVKENNIVELKAENVFSPTRGTNIKNDFDVRIHTVEHFLSALYVYGITDLLVEVSGNEMPIGDGSAFHFLELVDIAGVKEFDESVDVIEIKEPIFVAEEDRYVIGLPHNAYKVTYAIKFDHTFLKSQLAEFEITQKIFKYDISNARTFGFDYEEKYLKENNLALGASLQNAIVITDNGVKNEDGLRFEDEFVRHKILDLVGDMKVLNRPIKGHIIAIKAGHSLHSKFAKKLLKTIGGE